jgi:hypothetical protein
MNRLHFLITLFASITLSSCIKEDTDSDSTPNNTPNGNGGQQLFFSFQTPDWQRSIACDQMDFNPGNEIAPGLAYALATSASTNATFGFPFPTDSSAMALTSNIKKYRISGYNPLGMTDGLSFELSLKLNKTGISDLNRLYSTDGLTDSNYNEVTAINYVNSDADYANFHVIGNYKMDMIDPLTNEEKPVTGSYCLKFKTLKQ